MKNMVMENPRPHRAGDILVHGLICCKSGCGYWNRDVNGATSVKLKLKASLPTSSTG